MKTYITILNHTVNSLNLASVSKLMLMYNFENYYRELDLTNLENLVVWTHGELACSRWTWCSTLCSRIGSLATFQLSMMGFAWNCPTNKLQKCILLEIPFNPIYRIYIGRVDYIFKRMGKCQPLVASDHVLCCVA